MNLRRISVVLVTVAAVGGAVVLGRDPVRAAPATFTKLVSPKTPYVPLGNQIASTFFCPGVPTTGDKVTATVSVSNPGESEVTGDMSLLNPTGEVVHVPVQVAARSVATFDIAAMLEVDHAGVMVELTGGGSLVEQRVSTPAGTSVAACGNDASATWYFADGSTLDGVTYNLLLSNPFPDDAIVDLAFVTATDTRLPSAFQSYVVPPGSIRSIQMDKIEAQNESQLSISVVSRRGRVVAAKEQSFASADRKGYVLALGSPSLGDQWYFADGDKGTDISESVVLYNPTEADVDVDILPLPSSSQTSKFPPAETVTVPAGRSTVVEPTVLFVPKAGDDTGVSLPDGSHSLVISTQSTDSIVAERVITRPTAKSKATSVMLGSRYGSSRWWLPTGPSEPTAGALVIQNVTNLTGTVTVSYVGPGGEVKIEGMTDLPVSGGAQFTLDLLAPEAVGKPVVVSSPDLQLIVEQRYPRANGSGQGASLAVPE